MNTRDCIHGRLARSCTECELADFYIAGKELRKSAQLIDFVVGIGEPRRGYMVPVEDFERLMELL